MPSKDYEQHTITLLLKDIQVCGLPHKTLGGLPDTFITVSVDGDQQLQTELFRHSLDPKWNFSHPVKLHACPSSQISFAIHRKRGTDIFGDKHLAVFDAPLLTYIQEGPSKFLSEFSIEIKHSLSTETCKLKVRLEVDTSYVEIGRDSLFDDAEEKLNNITGSYGRNSRSDSAKSEDKTAGSVLGTALDSLDQLVKVVDGIAEIHPWCQVAWTLLSAVYKGIKNQSERDGKVKDLSHALQDALARARECRNLKAIEGATDVIKALARLVVEGAVLIDEYMKHSTAGKVARSTAGLFRKLDTRIEECQKKLGDLKTDLLLDLAIRNHQNGEKANPKANAPWEPEHRYEPITWPCSPPVPAPPPRYLNMPSPSKYNDFSTSLATGGQEQKPRHPTAFPSPIRYPEVITLSNKSNSMHRTINPPNSNFPLPSSPPPLKKEPRCRSPAPVQLPTPQPRPSGRWHSQWDVQQLQEMFPLFSDDTIEETLIAKGSQAAAIETLLEMTGSSAHPSQRASTEKIRHSRNAHAPGSESILGLGFTHPPLEMPGLSRKESCNDDGSAVTTPASENFEDSAIIDSPPEGFCDGNVGGFTPPLNRPKRQDALEPGWIPNNPIGHPRHFYD